MKLSIVVAVQGGSDRLPTLLQQLAPQIAGHASGNEEVEVLVPYAAEEQAVPSICGGMPGVRAIAGAQGALTPELWRDGILEARGERVALSIVHCRPAAGWVEQLLAADMTTFAGIGGSLINAPESDAAGWAIFMLRYLRYAPPQQRHETDDIPGDNAVYDRAALMAHREAFEHGFWEPEVHALLIEEGRRLLFDPALSTVHHNGYEVRSFAGQRYQHGAEYGFDRARKMPPLRRLAYLAATPAVPMIFGAKILRAALALPDARAQLPRALPYLLFFLQAWAAGEARGALRALLSPSPSP